jgi:hypothetical protein
MKIEWNITIDHGQHNAIGETKTVLAAIMQVQDQIQGMNDRVTEITIKKIEE